MLFLNYVGFFKEYLLPEILTPKLVNSQANTSHRSVPSKSEPLYCLCHQEEARRDMISCETIDCVKLNGSITNVLG